MRVQETSQLELERIFKSQQRNRLKGNVESVSERIKILDILQEAILSHRDDIKAALRADLGKSGSESDLTEVYAILSEIRMAKRSLHRWMRKQKVGSPLVLFGSSSHVYHEPKGVVLIISPWNFPFNLTFCPLVSAIAAGNRVMLKPSELTPHCSRLMKEIIESLFKEEDIAIVQGGVGTSTALLELPFDHIFFTGSPQVGKIVMQAAAKNLTSVTLELGGKSPTIVDRSADLKLAAKRITWAKFMNNGQVCIAPDLVYVHQEVEDEFISLVKERITQFYGTNSKSSSSYSRVVNTRHTERIASAIEESMEQGARVEIGGQVSVDEKYIAPTVITHTQANTTLRQEEIFGPVMPIISFDSIQNVIDDINSREKPLALYIYSRDNKIVNFIHHHTSAGGGCVNHSAIHFFNHHLPFGGVNNSGLGKSHGRFGFEAFSNKRGVLRQHTLAAGDFLMPPYDRLKQRLIDLAIKYL